MIHKILKQYIKLYTKVMHTNTCMQAMILKQSMLNFWQKILIRIQSKFHLTNILMGYWVRPSIKTKCFIGKVDEFPSFNISKLWKTKVGNGWNCSRDNCTENDIVQKFIFCGCHPLPPCSLKKCWKTAGRCNVLLWVIQQWVEWHKNRRIFRFLNSWVQSNMT